MRASHLLKHPGPLSLCWTHRVPPIVAGVESKGRKLSSVRGSCHERHGTCALCSVEKLSLCLGAV